MQADAYSPLGFSFRWNVGMADLQTRWNPRMQSLWRITLTMILVLGLFSLYVGMTLPSLGTAPEVIRRSEVMHDLKILGLAYQAKTNSDPRGRVPPVAIVDPEGKPLLSWRVLFLPQIDEQELFEKFDLTKPWDSPENLPLIEQMPDLLASPYDRHAAKKGKTPFKAIISDDPQWNTAWPKPGGTLRFSDFKDGLSDAALVVVDLSNPVIWTKPEEITPGAYLKSLDHGQWASKYFLIGFADGSVRTFEDPTEEEILPLLFVDDGLKGER